MALIRALTTSGGGSSTVTETVAYSGSANSYAQRKVTGLSNSFTSIKSVTADISGKWAGFVFNGNVYVILTDTNNITDPSTGSRTCNLTIEGYID